MVISNLGAAMAHWLGFQEKIGRSFMMNEDALKYPLADYLVNGGGINLKSIVLVCPHPNFSNRLVDLAVYRMISNEIENMFELKLAKSETRYPNEQQRIFDDLIRLHLARKVSIGKCYFIIAGKAVHFERDFRDFKQYPSSATTFYSEWFEFTLGKAKTFSVAGQMATNYSGFYQNFLTGYKQTYRDGRANNLELPNEITTFCEFVTPFKSQFVPYLAGVWSVT